MGANSHTLLWAIIGSMLLHGLLAFLIPNLKFDEVKKPDILVVELVKKPELPPVVLPEPIPPKPEPVKPKVEPKPEPKPLIKPLPAPTEIKNDPVPPPPTEVIAVAPKPDAPPSPVPPVAIVKPEPTPAQPSCNEECKTQYGEKITELVRKNAKMPRIARERGYQGIVKIKFIVDAEGKILSSEVEESSGHQILDTKALEQVRALGRLPHFPDGLGTTDFRVEISYVLKEE